MMKRQLAALSVLGVLALASCVIADPPATPRAVTLSSSAMTVTSAGPITLSARVRYGGGIGIGWAVVGFYDGATLIGQSSSPTPASQGDLYERQFDLSVNLTSTQNGLRSYTAKVAGDGGRFESAPVTVTVNIPQ